MKWLLVYISLAQNNQVQDTLEFDTRELCEQRGIALLEFSARLGLKTQAICRNAETGEEFKIEIPKRTTA